MTNTPTFDAADQRCTCGHPREQHRRNRTGDLTCMRCACDFYEAVTPAAPPVSATHPVGCICETCSADYERNAVDPRMGKREGSD